jgi:pyruvate carboxylase
MRKFQFYSEAEEYYGNIANLAKWYSINQNLNKTEKSVSNEKDNPFIAKLKNIKIKDENGNRFIFELTTEERNDFFKLMSQRKQEI